MHPPGAPRRRPAHQFSNHTPRPFEVQGPGSQRPLPVMFGSTGMVVSPGPVPYAAQNVSREPTCDSSISEDSIVLGSLMSSQQNTRSQDESRTTSSGLSVASTQAHSREPFLDKMMTQTNLLVLPPSNPSYQMAYFLITTGPVAEEKPGKVKRISSAMRLFRSSTRRPSESLTAAHRRLNDVLSEEPMTESVSSIKDTREPKLPNGVVQRVSKTGRKYYQIEQTCDTQPAAAQDSPSLSPDILESSVSVFLADQASAENLGNWILNFESNTQEAEVPVRGAWMSTTKIADDGTVRILDGTPARIMAPASPSLESGSGIDIAALDLKDFHDKIAPLRSHPVLTDVTDMPLPLYTKEARSSQRSPIMNPQLAHPSPLRVGGRSGLLQRASSDITGLRWSRSSQVPGERSVSDSPGLPLPRSPSRTNSLSQPLGNILSRPRPRVQHAPSPEKRRPRVAHTDVLHAARSQEEACLTALPQLIKDGTHGKGDNVRLVSRATEAARDDVFSSVNIRSKYSKSSFIDTMIKPSQSNTPRRRLKKASPEGPRQPDFSKVQTQTSATHIAEASFARSIRRTLPLHNVLENARIVPTDHGSSPRLGYARRPTNAFLRDKKGPAPRPRSAKMVRSHAKSPRTTHTRAMSPVKSIRSAGTPQHTLPRTDSVLPSPPPRKELPPTPTKKDHQTPTWSTHSAITIDAALARACSTKVLPSPPRGEHGRSLDLSPPPSHQSSIRKSHLGTLSMDQGEKAAMSPLASTKDERLDASSLEARLDAIERRNRLLEAALMAVLKTSGTLNGCPCSLDSGATSEHTAGQCHDVHHRSQCSIGSSTGRDVLDLFKETKGRC